MNTKTNQPETEVTNRTNQQDNCLNQVHKANDTIVSGGSRSDDRSPDTGLNFCNDYFGDSISVLCP